MVADSTLVLASHGFPSLSGFQSVVQQPRFSQFMPFPFCSRGFLPFDPRVIFLNNGNVNTPRIPMQQHNFNYISSYPSSSMAFFQQPFGQTIDTPSTGYAAYSNANSSFTYPGIMLRSPMFSVNQILNNGGTRG